MPSEATLTEISVNYHTGGKVAIRSFGKETVDFGGSISRRYAIPEGWTAEQIAEFEAAAFDEIRAAVEAKVQPEYEVAIEAQAEFYDE